MAPPVDTDPDNQDLSPYVTALLSIAVAGLLFVSGAWAQTDLQILPEESEFLWQLKQAEDSRLQPLSEEVIDDLVAGRTVIHASGSGSNDGGEEVADLAVQGWRIVNAPRLLVWVALLGGSDMKHKNVTQAMLERRQHGSYVKFQHVNLPWPVADRHWVILCEKDTETAIGSAGKIWRHHWSLLEDGEKRVQQAFDQGLEPIAGLPNLEKSVYLPANRGSFALVEISPRMTLIAVDYDVDLGGLFPGSIVRALSARRLKAGLLDIDGHVAEVFRAYSDQDVIHDGFGRRILPSAVLRRAAEWNDDLAGRADGGVTTN